MPGNALPVSRLEDALSQLIRETPSLPMTVNGLLRDNPLLLAFSPGLESCFRLKRLHEFSAIFRISAAFWALLFAVLMGFTHLFFPELLSSGRFALWQNTCWLVGGIVVLANITAYLPSLHNGIYHYVIAPVSGLLLYLLLLGGAAYPDQTFNIHASYNAIIIMVLISYSMRLRWQVSGSVLMAAGVMAILTALAAGWKTSWLQAGHAYLLVGIVLSVIAFFVERRERLGFLQEVLVAIKSEELAQLNDHLSAMASKDALSGLSNRRAFDEFLNREWERGRREEQPLSILFMDVDFFKRYNDTYGHAAGDECLKQVARAMNQALLRPGDIVARYGGEEFVVLLPNTDVQGAMEVGDRLLAAVDALAIPHHSSDAAFHVTISIGIACMVPTERNGARNLLEEADRALYEAKSRGRHRMACLQPVATPTYNVDDIILMDIVKDHLPAKDNK
ncbi:diguanylate cyclase (GGDEF)-like protein [Fluviicoccus keumensis]|uniref:diguanylate cyclase n=1 Tax=Fluviicoccus keumensis TaxID=1435465 RepID=A0A4Q7YNQ3_9GAMM|nr:diguanylate cyclase [Fluviicoccus keumensis]RZU38319.1 diguanylate cyclase (GGDEF)-like protein [Fluviicoccus keumensis]